MPNSRSCLFLSLLLFAGCDSKVTETLDPDLQNRVATVEDCFPETLEQLQVLLDLADTWRMNAGNTSADPSGLTWSEQGNGTIDLSFTSGGATLTATISFYSPTGTLQDLDLSGATSLNDAIDRAADELRNLFGSADKFMVGDWDLAGAGLAGSGALTGIIGGSTNQNELEELRTTTAVPAGGPPPNADGTITVTGAHTCVLTFNTTGLQTDTEPTQEYPIGVVTFTLQGPDATVSATMTFDGTVTASVAVADVPGSFAVNLETRNVTYVR